ncbi:MAG: cytochrome c class I [Muricauda sp.]|nr:cytochrome c class I [Allomuricauda sp.]|tara:strand:- start:185 stop:592 length:408 start_codon:yes stop_codon:yes gene_type:complete
MEIKKTLTEPIVLAGLMLLLAMPSVNAQDEWKAPESADKLTNPLKNDASAVANGKRTYRMLCVICHGAKGKGDGMGGAGLTPKPTDLTNADVQAQTDGALFWKLTEGRPPMASYKTALPEKKRWELINYIRTLKQ